MTPFKMIHHDVAEMITNETFTRTVQFMLPIQHSKKRRIFQGHPYVPIIASPGFALFVKPRDNSFAVLLGALKPVMPIFFVSIFAVPIAGVLFWLIESWATVWEGGRPQHYHPGVWDGVWWAFITMTTIGYGDIMPRTTAGRIFSVLWILAGMVLSGVVVSTIASVLIAALSPKVLQLRNQHVAVLHGSEEGRYTFKKQGHAHEYENLTAIINALDTDEVNMAVVDVLIAAQNSDHLSEFVLDRIIEEETSVGVAFLPMGTKYATCFHEYILNNQRDIINNVSKIVKGSTYKSYRPVSPSSVIDPTLPAVQYTFAAILIFILILYISCLLKKWLVYWMAPRNAEHANTRKEMQILKENKETYLNELDDILKVRTRKCLDDLDRIRRSKEMWSTLIVDNNFERQSFRWKRL